jgi:hypothetical protein
VVLLSADLLIFELMEGLQHQLQNGNDGFQLILVRNPPGRDTIAIQNMFAATKGLLP